VAAGIFDGRNLAALVEQLVRQLRVLLLDLRQALLGLLQLLDGCAAVLEPILRNRFGRNLRIKPNLVKFKFVI
jgi:hypothetical protein